MISFFMCKVKIKLKNKVIFSCVCQSHTAILTRDKQLIQIIYYTIYVRGLPVDMDVVWGKFTDYLWDDRKHNCDSKGRARSI